MIMARTKSRNGSGGTGSGHHAGGTSSGQMSLELLLIVTFMFITLVPLVYYIYNIVSEDSWKIEIQQTQTVVGKIVEYSDKLPMGGEGSTIEATLYFPSSVVNFTTYGNVIVLTTDVPRLGIIDQVALAQEPVVRLGNWDDIAGMQRVHFNYSHGTVYVYRG